MRRILTATRDIDLFGAGKDGFNNEDPGVDPATQLDQDWFNDAQESIVRTLEAAGIPQQLDASLVVVPQLLQAIHGFGARPAAVDISHLTVGSPQINGAIYDEEADLFILVCNGGDIYTSSTGEVWTPRTTSGSENLNAIAAKQLSGNQLLVAVGADPNPGGAYTSTDGLTWTQRDTNAGDLYCIAWGTSDNLFVASGASVGSHYTSTDGITWIPRTKAQTAEYYGMAHGNGRFVAVGQSGAIETSDDGVTWTIRTSPSANTLRAVHYGADLFADGIGGFVAVGDNATIITSPDGITWTSRNGASGYSPAPAFRAVHRAGPGNWLLASSNAYIFHGIFPGTNLRKVHGGITVGSDFRAIASDTRTTRATRFLVGRAVGHVSVSRWF
jgi:hypothetical protein